MINQIKIKLPLDNLIRKSEKSSSPSKSIFFLHGFGSNMQDLFGLSPFFDNNWTCVSLQASIPVQYNGWAWAELDFQNIGKLPKPEQMKSHQEKVLDSINQCINDLDLDPERVNLLGFSQGASLTIYSGLMNPEKFNSVVALSGFFPVEEILDNINKENISSLDLFMGHGKFDSIVPLQLGQRTRRELIDLGMKPFFNEYDSEHTIPNECLKDLIDWLRARNEK
tara:strand:+ start:615 stop:1286 length:672 start_codon:yes stop_codon:yes gene_type:complete